MAVRVFHRDEADTWLPMVAKDARLVIWPGVGAWDANMNYVRMEPGEQNRIHSHPTCEDTIAIVSGEGSIEDVTNGVEHEFRAGQVIHIPPGIVHRLKASRGVVVETVGGPCPADVNDLRAAGLITDEMARP